LKKSILKEIFEYIFRVCTFLLLTRHHCCIAAMAIVSPAMAILNIFTHELEDELFIMMVAVFIYFYIVIKICGLFKKLDNLNFFLSLPIVILLDIIFEIWIFFTNIQIFPLKFSFHKPYFVYYIIIYYIIYKIFNILAKKFPMPFGRIGYYTSIEFWRSIAVKICKTIAKNYRTY